MTDRGAGALDRLLMGATAVAVENNGVPCAALIDLFNFIGVTFTYHAPSEGDLYGSVDVELTSAGTIAWSAITGKPTTVSESGIADAVSYARTLTATSPLRIDGVASADFSSNRTLSILASSPSQNGYLSKEDKQKLDRFPDYPDEIIMPQWYAEGGYRFPLYVQEDVGIQFTFAEGTLRIKTNFPPASWYAEDGYYYPTYVQESTGITIERSVVDGVATIYIKTNFEIPNSSELNFGVWGTQTAILGSDTSKDLGNLNLTDVDKANGIWIFAIDVEVALWRQSDSSVQGRLINAFVVTATYNSSGVPTLKTIVEGSGNALLMWQDNEQGLPAFTGLSISISGATVHFTAAKNSGGNDCYGKVRARKSTQLFTGVVPS